MPAENWAKKMEILGKPQEKNWESTQGMHRSRRAVGAAGCWVPTADVKCLVVFFMGGCLSFFPLFLLFFFSSLSLSLFTAQDVVVSRLRAASFKGKYL